LVDLDGTIADCQHRRHYVDGSRSTGKNWDGFFDPKEVMKDALIEPVRDLILAMNQKYPIVYVTARREELRDTSVAWLRKHGLWTFPHKMYMRKVDDRRSDDIVKREILNEIRQSDYEPYIAIDDRSSVVAMWRSEGLTCFQVAPGDF
jgi:NLI interacting factor-like phosphatase.